MVTLAILTLLFQSGLPEGNPVFVETARGLGCRTPVSVLDEPEVRKQFRSGLTSSFRILVTSRQSNGFKGAARIEIRYELWDEWFLVNVLEADGKVSRYKHESIDALKSWWQSTPIIISPESPKFRESLRVSLSFVPFSQSEQEGAREWIVDSAKPGSTPVTGVDNIFRTIMATSIKRKPLLQKSWRISYP